MNLARKAVIAAFLCILPALIYARDIVISVEDEDLGWPLEGAVVILRSGQQFVCDGEGIARITLPDNRQTFVQVTYPGYETLRLTIPQAPPDAVNERFTAALRLGGVMTGRELVVEAERPDTSETKTGRSVAISERELSRTAEIGIIEDVMSSVKLLPGVGYTGMFGAMPSIRGGDPGDLVAVFDGFYLERPYHWAGAVSIFDPKMVSSARLSHGVFSSRYGHTVSGLLEIASKSPSPTEVDMEAAIGSSAASLNLSWPLNGKGGILFMGKVSYWDTLVWAAKQLSKVIDDENLAMINSVSTSPYIRSAALSANYRINADMEWRLNAFFGSDGVGAASTVEYDQDGVNEGVDGTVQFDADYSNYQGFLISGITASPSPVLALKATGGVGFIRTITDDTVRNNVTVRYNSDFLALFPPGLITDETYTTPNVNVDVLADHTIFNAQARADLDWDLGKGLIAAFGVQELYSYWMQDQHFNMIMEFSLEDLKKNPTGTDRLPPGMLAMLEMFGIPNLAINLPAGFGSELKNHGFTTSAYGLLEYTGADQRFGMELGLRVDHMYLFGKNFGVYTEPALNPRLNFDFNILKNNGLIDSLDFTAGSGLFSSINDLVSFVDMQDVAIADTLKFNRSWTSILGFKIDFLRSYSFNIEGFYKYIFDRGYITADTMASSGIAARLHSDGIGHVGGFDFQLQKLESRYWDGWISYSFTWAQYYNPNGGGQGVDMGGIESGGPQWFFPDFHRFHNYNIVLNIKPLPWFNISARLGLASGQLRERTLYEEGTRPYPVIYFDEDGSMEIHQKYRREPKKDANGNNITVKERMPWSLPLDIKLSFFVFNKKGRARMEIYLAGENLLWFYRPAVSGNTRYNEYTGVEDPTGASGGGMFDFPIPLVSFGFKWRY